MATRPKKKPRKSLTHGASEGSGGASGKRHQILDLRSRSSTKSTTYEAALRSSMSENRHPKVDPFWPGWIWGSRPPFTTGRCPRLPSTSSRTSFSARLPFIGVDEAASDLCFAADRRLSRSTAPRHRVGLGLIWLRVPGAAASAFDCGDHRVQETFTTMFSGEASPAASTGHFHCWNRVYGLLLALFQLAQQLWGCC